MKTKYDLIVCGGGFAGTAAAVAAAREGADVLIIEKSGFLGGAAGNCQVNPFMPYFTKIDGVKTYLSAGLFKEIISELAALGGLRDDGVFNDEILKLVLDRLTAKYSVTVLFHSYITDVIKEDDRICAVSCTNKSGLQTYHADFFIDATGDADIAALCGCPFRVGRSGDNLCQPMTLCFNLADVDVDKIFHTYSQINELYRQKCSEGKIKNPRGDVLYMRHMSGNILHLNSTRVIRKSPINVFDVSEAEREAREQVFELFTFLKENCEGFENAVLLPSGPEIGVRESRMIDGLYTLTQEDLKSCTKFSDGIAACNYDIDIHSPDGSGTSHYYFEEGTYYTIPYRCLVPQGISNLLVAGRCISGTHEAQASYRIMPVCCTLGEAAGTAAALALNNGCHAAEVDTDKLRELLTKNGAFI
ncbi:MAG: FAD-dependent oxidoreductase [Clostridiales bacterium]|nr:FAD-dependent oxidoreductase [Clostridiales bacterium]